ncbi:hypothetical protein JCM11491_001296 [Sporobolomyces phaffii]
MTRDVTMSKMRSEEAMLRKKRSHELDMRLVSFSCEACGDILKKPKLDQHAGRCRGAYYTCIDCNTTFDGPVGGNGYRSHTSCVSEEQRYHKSVYKEPKKKGGKQQQNKPQDAQNAQEQAPPAAAPTPVTPTATEDSKKRAREDIDAKQEEAPVVAAAKETTEAEKESGEGEPSKKKKKKSKKSKGDKEESGAATATEEPAAKQETLSTFLSSTLGSILADSVSIVTLREKVIQQAKEKGFTNEKEVEKALFEGMSVGGKKSKVKYEFA